MALRLRSQLSASSQNWKRCSQAWLPSPFSGRATSAGLHRFESGESPDGLMQEARERYLIRPVLESGPGKYSVYPGILSPVPSATHHHDWRSMENITQRSASQSFRMRKSYGDHCGALINAAYTTWNGLSNARTSHPRCFTSQGKQKSEVVDSVPAIELPAARENESKGLLADKLEDDAFLREVRNAKEVTKGETVDASDDEADDGTRLGKAEREYLEALGKGDVADLDLEQLEQLLGEMPTDDSTVGSLYLKLGQEYDMGGENPENILRCGQKALKIFQSKGGTEDLTLEVAMGLHLISTAYIKLEKYEKSLISLQKAQELLEKTEGEETRAAKCNIRFLFGEALFGLGKPDEALNHLRPAVTDQELILGQDHPQLGRSYRKIAEVLTQVMKHDEALPFVQKALEIHMKAFGEGSMEEAVDRRILAVIYIGLGDNVKALEQHQLVSKILSKTEHASETVFVDISTADTEISLGKYDDALSTLQNALSKAEQGSAMHALVLVNLAKVYERKKKPEMADKYAKMVLVILENKVLARTDPLTVAEGYIELAALYEKINKAENAIELLKKAHEIYAPIPNQRNAVAGTQAQIGMLLFFTGKVGEAVPFLENAAENLEGAVGDENFALAMVLNHLGVANVELENLEAATKYFERAKGIFVEVLGADHDDTIAVVRNLVNTYSLLDRLDDAITSQKEVISELRKKGDEMKEMLQEAVEHLEMLEDHRERGKSVNQTLGSDPRQYERVISE